MFGDTILTQDLGFVCRALYLRVKIPDGNAPSPGRQLKAEPGEASEHSEH
jgi:hypothetical protein